MSENQEISCWDTIVIGAGAAGLFFGANYTKRASQEDKCLILEKSNSAAKKLLITGGGACNLTQGGDIKSWVQRYGKSGKKIRKTLHSFNNKDLINYFEEKGVSLIERDDGKIFPKSMSSLEIKRLLESELEKNSIKINLNEEVTSIKIMSEPYRFIVNDKYKAKNLIVATGGASYPQTGSDGRIFPLIQNLGIEIVSLKEALVPLRIKEYPFSDIEGVSVQNCKVKMIDGKTKKKIAEEIGGILFTDKYISGPAILNISRYSEEGHYLKIHFADIEKIETKGVNQSLINFLTKELELPKSLIMELLKTMGTDGEQKASAVSPKSLNRFVEGFDFEIIGTAGFKKAMVTTGGVALSEINLNTYECKKIEGLYIIGEALDIDGDTGGYNLQFAFASAIAALKDI